VTVGYVTSDETAAAAIVSLGESIQRETLSQLQPARLPSSDAQSVCELDDSTIELTLQR
jgi:hypothetical protein